MTPIRLILFISSINLEINYFDYANLSFLFIIMKVELIKRIRSKLSINPESKSTLLRKSELLEYARQLREENKAMREILQPTLGAELSDIEREREEKNITLVLHETALRDEKYKYAMLKNSVEYYRAHI